VIQEETRKAEIQNSKPHHTVFWTSWPKISTNTPKCMVIRALVDYI
jgi:hypothetical protein